MASKPVRCPAIVQKTADEMRSSAANTSTRSRPAWSASQPNSGLSAYMPATCKLITRPTSWSVAPPRSMCTGVMDINPTMTKCDRAIPPVPSSAGCEANNAARTSAPVGTVPAVRAPQPVARARTSGSGRNPHQDRAAASPNIIAHNRNGPVVGLRLARLAMACTGPAKFGPATAPKVVAQTTSAKARARRCGSARSVAAKRAARLAAVPAPMSTRHASRAVGLPVEIATAAAQPPSAPAP